MYLRGLTKPSRALFLVSGIIMLLSLLFMEEGSYALWITAKIVFFAGLVILLFDH